MINANGIPTARTAAGMARAISTAPTPLAATEKKFIIPRDLQQNRQGASKRAMIGDTNMFVTIGIAVVVVLALAARFRPRGRRRSGSLGSMSERWLAENRASHSN